MEEEEDPMSVLSSSSISNGSSDAVGGTDDKERTKCENLASAFVGAEVIAASSQVPGCEASNTLYDSQELMWRCDPGLPQWMVLRLCPSGVPNLGFGRDTVTRVGWSCARAQSSNPRKVSVQASRHGSTWRLVAELSCTERKGLFDIAPLKVSDEPLVRITVTRTSGESQCSINKLFFYTDGGTSLSSNSSSTSSESSSNTAFFAKSSESIASKLAALRASEKRQMALFATLDHPTFRHTRYLKTEPKKITETTTQTSSSRGKASPTPEPSPPRRVTAHTQTDVPPRTKGEDFLQCVDVDENTLADAAPAENYVRRGRPRVRDVASQRLDQTIVQHRVHAATQSDRCDETASTDAATQSDDAMPRISLSHRREAASQQDVEGRDAGTQWEVEAHLELKSPTPAGDEGYSQSAPNEQLVVYEEEVATENSASPSVHGVEQREEVSEEDDELSVADDFIEEETVSAVTETRGSDRRRGYEEVPVQPQARSPRRRRRRDASSPRGGTSIPADATACAEEDELSPTDEFGPERGTGEEMAASPRTRERPRRDGKLKTSAAGGESSPSASEGLFPGKVPQHRSRPPPQPSSRPEREDQGEERKNVVPPRLSAENEVVLRALTQKVREKRKKMKALLRATLREKVRERKLKTIELISRECSRYVYYDR